MQANSLFLGEFTRKELGESIQGLEPNLLYNSNIAMGWRVQGLECIQLLLGCAAR